MIIVLDIAIYSGAASARIVWAIGRFLCFLWPWRDRLWYLAAPKRCVAKRTWGVSIDARAEKCACRMCKKKIESSLNLHAYLDLYLAAQAHDAVDFQPLALI